MRTIGLGAMPFGEEQVEGLRKLARDGGAELLVLDAQNPDFGAQIAKCEALLGAFPKEHLQAARALRWLHVPSAGVDRYLPDELYTNEDAILTSSSGAFGIAISEYLVCGLLMILRRMPMYMDNQRARLWRQHPGAGAIYGSRVTVVGVGDLGANFARRCQALGARVTGVRRAMSGEIPPGFDRMLPGSQLDEAIADADAVALCLPATGETRGLFDAARIGKMKQGSILLNAGRGSAIDADALNVALRSGWLMGALLDVTDPEPLPECSPLWDAPGAIITPHISGIDRDALAAGIVFDLCEDNLRRYLSGAPLLNRVDRARGY